MNTPEIEPVYTVEEVIDGAFQDVALVIGGLLTLHSADQAFVERLMRSLSAIRRRTRKKLRAGRLRSHEPNPAIVAFLEELRGG